MCGKGSMGKALGGIDLTPSWSNPSQSTVDKWMSTYWGLHALGGSTGMELSGINRRAESKARHKQQNQLAWQKLQVVEAPEKTAMEVFDAEGVRDRRRKAALMGINQLRTPSGPGTASGGSYSGASGGTY